MAYTKNQIAYDIIELIRANYKDTDSLSSRQVKYWIDTLRAFFIEQSIYKSPYELSLELVQILDSIELEKVDNSLIEGISSGYSLYQTRIDIPETFREGDNLYTIRSLSAPLIAPNDFKQVPYNLLNKSGSGMYNRNKIFYAIRGNKIILKGDNIPLYINIHGIFTNPDKASLISNPNYTDNDPYPISTKLIELIKDRILARDFKASIVQYEDRNINDVDDTVNPTK